MLGRNFTLSANEFVSIAMILCVIRTTFEIQDYTTTSKLWKRGWRYYSLRRVIESFGFDFI